MTNFEQFIGLVPHCERASKTVNNNSLKITLFLLIFVSQLFEREESFGLRKSKGKYETSNVVLPQL